jgi:hypothetical protein
MESLAVLLWILLMHTTCRKVRFYAEDRLDAFTLAGAIEVDCAIHRSVIGQRQRRHVECCSLLRQVTYAAQAIQEGELAVDV